MSDLRSSIGGYIVVETGADGMEKTDESLFSSGVAQRNGLSVGDSITASVQPGSARLAQL